MRAEAEDVVTGASLPSVRGGAQRAREVVSPGGGRGSFQGGVVSHRPVTFMEQFLIVVRPVSLAGGRASPGPSLQSLWPYLLRSEGQGGRRG